MAYTKGDKQHAYDMLKQYRGRKFYAIVNSVSRSGMSRRIEYYCVDDYKTIQRIGYYIARICGYPYSVDKGGLSVGGCGQDMIFSVLSNFNYEMAKLDTELLDSKELGKNICDKHFTNASNYGKL